MLKKTLSKLSLLLLPLLIVAFNLSDYAESLREGYKYAHEGDV